MSYLKCIRSVLAWALLVAGAALAQYPTLIYSADSQYPLTEEIAFSAHVSNANTGQPVAGAVINWSGIVSALGDTPPPYVAGGAHYHNTLPSARPLLSLPGQRPIVFSWPQ